jgi:hypothetical protein
MGTAAAGDVRLRLAAMKHRMPTPMALVAVAAAAMLASFDAMGAGKAFADSACFSQKGSAASQGCEQLARQVSHDIETVRRLGEQLERDRRYDDAVSTYQTALV